MEIKEFFDCINMMCKNTECNDCPLHKNDLHCTESLFTNDCEKAIEAVLNWKSKFITWKQWEEDNFPNGDICPSKFNRNIPCINNCKKCKAQIIPYQIGLKLKIY